MGQVAKVRPKDGRNIFLLEVAQTNKLELLKWAREEKKCKWDRWTIHTAAEQGNLEMVKYCVANECPINAEACACAASNGHLEVLKYLREEVKAPWNLGTAIRAARNGHLHVLEYLVERKFDKYDEWACEYAAKYGHFDCLKYLHETAKAPWNSRAVSTTRTRTTTQNVYNTSSTTTVLSHPVGDTNMENCTRPNHHHNNTNTSRARICFKALVITYTQRERERHQHSARASFKFIF